MTATGLYTFDHSLNTTKEWLRDLQSRMRLTNEEQSLFVLRAVLQALRDRLTVEECASFAAEIPMLLQGVYYHGWKPGNKPLKIRSEEEFVALVDRHLNGRYDPHEAIRNVFAMLSNRMSAGEIRDIKEMLPESIRRLWPDSP